MTDLKLRHGAQWFAPIYSGIEVKSSIIKADVDNFVANASRVHALATLLSNMIIPTIVIEQSAATANFALDLRTEIISDQKRSDVVNGAINSSLMEHYRDIVDTVGKDPSERYVHLVDTAYKNIQFFSDMNDVTFNAVKSWFYSQLTGMWTAFEVVCSDIWVSSVNAKPNLLHGYGTNAKLGNAIHIDRLVEHNFNISNSLGTLLREKKNFDSLSSIKENYKDSFAAHGEEIIENLYHPSLALLNNVRHIIVHNSSRYDRKYLDAVKFIDTKLKGDIGDEIQINGSVVHDLLFSSINQMKAFILKIDAWHLKQG